MAHMYIYWQMLSSDEGEENWKFKMGKAEMLKGVAKVFGCRVEHFQADGAGEFGLAGVGGEEFFYAKQPCCGDMQWT